MNCKNKSFMTKRKAFTLIELLIVIAIIGILFIVLVSKVDFATDKAKATGVQTDFRSFQVAIETVAKEHSGFNTFGWDTGDTNGDRIRNSYDKGDTNKNGKQDPGEVFVGSKTYGETWTNVYTLTNPADANDKSAIVALESAINANLDPKLHITINDDLTISMANGAKDPWNTEYHGYYITNATVDKKDRGAILMYSNGANQEFGSEHKISNGIVNVYVPGSNVYGQDDYSIAVVYTYVNNYGEVKSTTSGFSKNQTINNQYDGNMNIGGNNNFGDDGNLNGPDILTGGPGLYETGSDYTVLLKTWDQLISEGIIEFYYEMRYDVLEPSLLNGDLILPDEAIELYWLDFRNATGLTNLILPDGFRALSSNYLNTCTSLQYNVYENMNYLGTKSNPYYCCVGPIDTTLTEYVVHPNTKTICDEAFDDCSNAEKITIPDMVWNIGAKSWNLPNLKYNKYDNGLYIGNENNPYVALVDVSDENLTSITFHPDTKVVGAWALEYSSITEVNFNDGLLALGISSMYGISEDEIVLPNSLQYLGYDSFEECLELKKIVIPPSITRIPPECFYWCPKLTEIVLPNTLTDIGTIAFGSCESLTTITLPNSVVYMGEDVFEWDEKLESVVLPSKLQHLGEGTFWGCDVLKTVVWPSTIHEIPAYTFIRCSALESFDIPSHVTAIGDGAFEECSSLRSINIHDGITVLGEEVFRKCSSLEEAYISGNIVSFGDRLFYGCSSLSNVTTSNNLKKLGLETFKGCSSLSSFYIGKNLDVGLGAFAGSGLTEFQVHPDHPVYTVVDGLLCTKDGKTLVQYPAGNTATDFTVPETILYIGDGAFYGSNLVNITCHNNILSIGDSTFASSARLKTVVLSNKITKIPKEAFKECKALTNIEIPSSVIEIGNSAFDSCHALTTVVIPDNVQTLGRYAFNNCSKLKTVTIGNGIKTLQYQTFNYCEALTTINMGSVEVIESQVFQYCSALTTLRIPKTLKTMGQAFYKRSGSTVINYEGTVEEWNAVEKELSWSGSWRQVVYQVVCTNGNLSVSWP